MILLSETDWFGTAVLVLYAPILIASVVAAFAYFIVSFVVSLLQEVFRKKKIEAEYKRDKFPPSNLK